MSVRILLASLVVVAANAADGIAEDWSEFRGPGGQGHSAAVNLPEEFGEKRNLAWKVPLEGEGWSSPVTYDGRIFLTSAALPPQGKGNDRALRVLCLDAASGKEIWNVQVFEQTDAQIPHIHQKNSHASPTPITDGKFVYVHYGTAGTACLTLDGEIVWRNRELVYDQRHGNGGSPVLVDGQLVVSCDGYDVQFVIALDRRTGDVRWKKSRPQTKAEKKFAFSTPLVIDVDGKKQIVSPGANNIVAYDPADGRSIWYVQHPGYSTIPRPVFAHRLIFMCTGYDRSELLAIRPDGRGDVTESHVAWRETRSVPHTPSLLVVGDDLYAMADEGILSCFHAATGELKWKKRIGGNYSASPLYADGKIYLLSEDGVATVVKPGDAYRELARNPLKARALASFGVIDQALLVRTAEHLYRFEKRVASGE